MESSLVVISPQPMQLGLYRLQEQLEGIITEEARGKIMEEGMRTGRLLIFIIQLKAQATRLSRSRPLRAEEAFRQAKDPGCQIRR